MKWEAKETRQNPKDKIFYHTDIVANGTIRVGKSTGVSEKQAIRYGKLQAAAPELLAMLKDATSRLIEWVGSDCECDNTHEATGRKCCICEYNDVIDKAE